MDAPAEQPALSPTDRAAIAAELGKPIPGVVRVAVRCASGHPCVVVNHPLRVVAGRVTPFPTLWWLTCPSLSQQLSCLERDGVIGRIEAELLESPPLLEKLSSNHESCIRQRLALLSDDDRRLAESAGVMDALRTRGIGGQENFAAVKCLHMHYAQHRVEGNVIGRILDERYDLRCRDRE